MSPAAGIHVPLLPEHKPKIEIKHATLPGAVFNVATSIIGAGIMSIPATFKVLGVIPAFLLIVIIAMLADVSVEFLMRFTHSGHSRTYAGVMRESFGRGGAVAAQVCVMVTNLGCLIMYLIIIGKHRNLPRFYFVFVCVFFNKALDILRSLVRLLSGIRLIHDMFSLIL